MWHLLVCTHLTDIYLSHTPHTSHTHLTHSSPKPLAHIIHSSHTPLTYPLHNLPIFNYCTVLTSHSLPLAHLSHTLITFNSHTTHTNHTPFTSLTHPVHPLPISNYRPTLHLIEYHLHTSSTLLYTHLAPGNLPWCPRSSMRSHTRGRGLGRWGRGSAPRADPSSPSPWKAKTMVPATVTTMISSWSGMAELP